MKRERLLGLVLALALLLTGCTVAVAPGPEELPPELAAPREREDTPAQTGPIGERVTVPEAELAETAEQPEAESLPPEEQPREQTEEQPGEEQPETEAPTEENPEEPPEAEVPEEAPEEAQPGEEPASENEPAPEEPAPPPLAGESEESAPEEPTPEEPAVPEEPTEEPEAPSLSFPPLAENEFVLSFAGDCTFGNDYGYSSAWDFLTVVGDDYDYPFAGVRPYFENDDFTLVNLEGALTDYNVPVQKTYRFRGPPAYAKILSGSGVEAVTLANNHSGDYGERGLSDTRAALEAEGVLYVDDGGTLLVETERGLKIGFCAFFWNGWQQAEAIAALQEAGAQLIVAVWHWGDEGSYSPNGNQTAWAHAAIDAGAHLVIGSHPHVLQRIEQYGNGAICYSLGNFSFGGNVNPRDKDTVVIRQHVFLNEDGTVTVGETEAVPCRLSSIEDHNDFQPTLYAEDSAEYARVMSKLAGTYGR